MVPRPRAYPVPPPPPPPREPTDYEPTHEELAEMLERRFDGIDRKLAEIERKLR